jgi:hypothetical protein
VDATLQFMWNLRLGGRPYDEPQRWALSMLEKGIESDSILRLAAESTLDRDVVSSLVRGALHDLKAEHLLDDKKLIDAYEKASVEDYYSGIIDGGTLILRGCDCYYYSGESLQRQFWINIADDADGRGQGLYGYPFDGSNFDAGLRQALSMHGFPERDASTQCGFS